MTLSKVNKNKFRTNAVAAGITLALVGPVMAAQFDGFEPGIQLARPDGVDENANTAATKVLISGDGSIITGRKGGSYILYGKNWEQLQVIGDGTMDFAGISTNGTIIATNKGKVLTGENWSQSYDLTTPTGISNISVTSMSSDGTTIIGSGKEEDAVYSELLLWNGANWGNVVKLEQMDGLGGILYNVSADGTVVAGVSAGRPVIWTGSGNTWSKPIDLGTLKSDNSGNGTVFAISGDGTVAAGYANSDIVSAGKFRPAVWTGSGNTWSKPTDLGTLRSDNSGTGNVGDISSDGTVIVGSSENDASAYNHATLWLNTGEVWGKGIDLDGSTGYSTASNISDDKTVVVGKAGATNSPSKLHITLWKLNWKDDIPEVVKGVDAINTVATIGQLAGDTFAAMELQRQGLIRLQDGCTTATQGEACGQVRAGIVSQGDQRDTATGFSLAYGVADNLSVGVSLDHSLNRSLPSSYQKNSNNIGAGLYALWNNPFDARDWFVRGAASFNQYNVDVIRPRLSNTEAGVGNSKMKGSAFTLEAGQNFHNQDGRVAGWNAGVRHSNITRAGYTETGAEFPVTYDTLDYGMTSAFLGGTYIHPLSDEVKLVTHAQIEQDLATNDAEYRAGASYIGGFVQKADMTKIRGLLTVGPAWDITKDMQASVMPYVGNSALGDTTWGADLRLTARF